MMGAGFGIGGLELIWMLLIWAGLLMSALWLVDLLFPVAENHHEDRTDSIKR